MNINLTLTRNEADDLIRQQLSLPTDTNVVVVEDNTTNDPYRTLGKFLDVIDNIVYGMDSNNSNKILAIKAYRIISECGFADAKYIIENWSVAKMWMNHYGKLLVNAQVIKDNFL